MNEFFKYSIIAFLCLILASGLVPADPMHVSTSTEKGLVSTPAPVDGESEKKEEPYWDRIKWGLIVDGIVQGNTSSSKSWDAQTDAVFGFDLEALFPAWENGSFYFLLEAGEGEGVDARIPTFSGFNDHLWSPKDGIQFTELWLEQKFFDGHFRGRVGKIDVTTDFDTNQYANCEHEQFISSGFVNNLTVDFPANSFGGMLWWEPTEKFTVGLCAQSNSGWNDVLHNMFGILEVGWHPVFNDHPGNYRFFGWTSTQSESEENSVPVKTYSARGWGFSFDQEIVKYVGVWCRYGSQRNEDFNDVKAHTSFGLYLMNFAWRPDDSLGVAYGIAQITDSMRDSIESEGRKAGDESHVEIYYRCAVNKFLALTPNFQWVSNPAGEADEKDVFVLGLRGTFTM